MATGSRHPCMDPKSMTFHAVSKSSDFSISSASSLTQGELLATKASTRSSTEQSLWASIQSLWASTQTLETCKSLFLLPQLDKCVQGEIIWNLSQRCFCIVMSSLQARVPCSRFEDSYRIPAVGQRALLYHLGSLILSESFWQWSK